MHPVCHLVKYVVDFYTKIVKDSLTVKYPEGVFIINLYEILFSIFGSFVQCIVLSCLSVSPNKALHQRLSDVSINNASTNLYRALTK